MVLIDIGFDVEGWQKFTASTVEALETIYNIAKEKGIDLEVKSIKTPFGKMEFPLKVDLG